MDNPSGGSYSMGMMDTEMYGRPSTSQLATSQMMSDAATPGVVQRGVKRCYDDGNVRHSQMMQVPENLDETFTNLGQPKKSPPSNGKKTKGRVKIKMEYIDNKLRRYTTFSKRKTGIMKKVCILFFCKTRKHNLEIVFSFSVKTFTGFFFL